MSIQNAIKLYVNHCKVIKKSFTEFEYWNFDYCKNISHIFVGNKILDNSDVVGASPVGAAPITSSFST